MDQDDGLGVAAGVGVLHGNSLISSAENYIVATRTLGWTPEQWRHTTATLLARSLLGETP